MLADARPGPLNLEVKTKASQLGGFPAAQGGWASSLLCLEVQGGCETVTSTARTWPPPVLGAVCHLLCPSSSLLIPPRPSSSVLACVLIVPVAHAAVGLHPGAPSLGKLMSLSAPSLPLSSNVCLSSVCAAPDRPVSVCTQSRKGWTLQATC